MSDESGGEGVESTDLIGLAGSAIGKPVKDQNGKPIGQVVSAWVEGDRIIADITVGAGIFQSCIFSRPNTADSVKPGVQIRTSRV